MDKWAVYKKCDDFRVSAPKSVLDLVEIKSISENGIFEVGKGGIFTKTYIFDDINYSKTSVDEQILILENWCKWLNSNSIPFKITLNNKNKNMETVQKDILFAQHAIEKRIGSRLQIPGQDSAQALVLFICSHIDRTHITHN